MRTTESRSATETGGRMGTFAGVFTPSILTILGIILFLRLGYVVGAAGLGLMLLILLAANLISVLTSLSLSAVATNLHVKKGGDYYLISRTLGQEFGGAIGLVLFLAQAVSVGFYCIGFAEAVVGMIPGAPGWSVQLIAALAALLLFGFAWKGADWATRLQFGIMVILALALVSFFIGGVERFDAEQLSANWSVPGEVDFWLLFAIFFPAVTGFTQGVSMSGELRDPGRSIPNGTLSAVALSILVYLLAAFLFAGALPAEILSQDYAAMQQVAVFAPLILAGVLAATLSSAMASFMGAPRILQSVSQDRLFPLLNPFSKGSGASDNPRRALLLSGVVALMTIGLGELDLIAPVVSMFFLISYGLINYATWFEAQSASPSFRPRFRFYHPLLSLAGALACLVAMLAIDLLAGMVALGIMALIYRYLQLKAPLPRWADGRRSYHTRQIRQHLLAIRNGPDSPRDWRPNILLFSDSSHRRLPLLKLAAGLEGGSGFVTAVKMLEGEGLRLRRQRDEVEKVLADDIQRARVDAWPLALTVNTFDAGLRTLLQGFGLGSLRANLILLNWLEHDPRTLSAEATHIFARHLWTAFHEGCSLLVFDGDENRWAQLEQIPPDQRRIDIWWWGDASSHLMLLLGHLMLRTPEWEGASLRILIARSDEDDPTATPDDVRHYLEQSRIDARAVLIDHTDPGARERYSLDASLVFLPFRLQRNEPVDCYGQPLNVALEPLPLSVAVLAAEDIDLDAEPEEGEAAERARALDVLNDARRLAELTAGDLEQMEADLAAAEVDATLDQAEWAQRQNDLEQARRRALKARARVETAHQLAVHAGVPEEMLKA
ncbi:amino acid permease [Marinobacterium iners]|uniref:Amino acid transporter n=1 Tax=Marinobacterium iners DSM 11526 TaxID=1122198 RepID=A0A1H4F6Y1_9GAMM|nr:amino acid permease [Marinobacterium iners]SEA92667.1 Amino acid transporter [Marinobacterium iners DSM 11526]